MQPDQSRTVRLASRVADERPGLLEQRLRNARTHVAINPATRGALECAELLLETLARGAGQISLDPTGLNDAALHALQQAAAAIRAHRPASITKRPPPGATQITVGEAGGDIVAVPDGYGARLERGGSPRQLRPPSRLGIMFTAALAAGEAFKEAAQLTGSVCSRVDTLAFCPVTLGEDLGAAPDLPVEWAPAVTLAGVGAIGTAHARILAELGRGYAALIDRESYAIENLETYSLGTADDALAAHPKVALAAEALSGWDTVRFEGSLADAVRAIDSGELPWTRHVLVGVDNPDARRDAQRLQPDRLIDAATAGSALGVRDARPDGPCIACMLKRQPPRDPTAALVALGIPRDVARAPGDEVVTDELIAAATDENARTILREHRGTPICGLLNAAKLTGAVGDEDFMPAAPFVSQQAACLGVGRLVAIALGVDDGLPNFVQYDALIGPHRSARLNRPTDPTCVCQQRQDVIAKVREERAARHP